MPNVTATPRGQNNGQVLTEFIDSVGTSSVTYTYPKTQESLSMRNIGIKAITVTVGGTSQTIQPGQRWEKTADFTAFNIVSSSGVQAFEATADEKGSEFDSLEGRYLTQTLRSTTNTRLSNNSRVNNWITNQGTTKLLFDGVVGDWVSVLNGTVSYPKDNTKLSTSPPKFELTTTNFDASFRRTGINLTVVDGDVLALWIWVDKPENLNKIELYVSNTSDVSMLPTNNYMFKVTGYELLPGWNMVKFQKVDCTVVGSPTWTTFQSMRLRVYPQTPNIPIVYMDSLLINHMAEPIVLLDFDDSQKTLFTNGYPYMESKGMKGTVFFCNRSYSIGGLKPTFMTSDDHKVLFNAGWDIGTHSRSHNDVIDLRSNQNYADQYEDLVYPHNDVINNGWTTSSPIAWAAPNGKWNDITVNVLRDLGYKIVRVSSTGFINTLDPDFNTVPTQEIQNTTTLATMKKWIDDAVRLGTTVSIFTHGVNIGNTDQFSVEYSTFQQLVDYVAAQPIKAMTFAEYYYGAFGNSDVQSKINSGTTVPDAKTVGDFYIRLQTSPAQNEMYLKSNGTWTKIGSLNV